MIATTATLTLPDGGALYDAVRGGVPAEFAAGRSAKVSFGAGELRAFARTARPIAGVRLLAPRVVRDFVESATPLRLELTATVVDGAGAAIDGPLPLRMRVVDPLGAIRHDCWRATRGGTLALALPLAADDPAGAWTVTVEELLAGTRAQARVDIAATMRAPVVGRVARAVDPLGDAERIWRFARVHRRAQIVAGSGPGERPQGERLARELARWGVRATVGDAAAVPARKLTDDERPSWVSILGSDPGYDLDADAILIGTPDDNPLIARLKQLRFLTVPSDPATFPGPGRGYVAWQRDGLATGFESITLIGYDETGLAEAVGTCCEMIAGLRPLTPTEPPMSARIEPAARRVGPPLATIAWTRVLPDRALALRADGDSLVAACADGSSARIGADGAIGVTAREESPTAVGRRRCPR